MLRDKDLQAGRRDLVQHAGCVEVGYRKIVEIEFGPVLDGDFRHPSHLIRLEICAGALLLFQCQLTGFDELVDDREARHQMVRETRQIDASPRSEEHTSELQSLMRSSYAVFCL